MLAGARRVTCGTGPRRYQVKVGRAWNIKLNKGEFIIKRTFSCSMGLNSPARTPENQDNMLLE